jgi:cytidylate kinase
MARTRPIVAIDGPAGAGKSTVARKLASALGFVLVDTGAIYRVLALAAQRASVRFDDQAGLGRLARALVADGGLVFESGTEGRPVVRLYGDDVSEAIRTPDIGMGASTVSAHGEVRAALLDLQRKMGESGGVVLEGRDIGTVVFPDAEVKFFLTASPEVRARRRYDELVAKGQSVTFEGTLEDVKKRDAQDTGREHAPLRQAESAIAIDSSGLTIEETVAKMAALVRATP